MCNECRGGKLSTRYAVSEFTTCLKRGIACSIFRLGVGPCGSASTFSTDKMELPLPAMCVIPFAWLGGQEEVA